MFVDSHTHLNDPTLLPRLDALLARMDEAGVVAALVVAYDLPSSRAAVELARTHPRLRAAIGVHPHESKDVDRVALAELRVLAEAPEVVAIGEIGLDFHYDHSPRDVQRAAFRAQLALAGECGLPIVIHEREAAEEAMAILDETGGWACGGAWHCCSTTSDLAVEIARRLYVGIAGWITFPKADNIRALARAVPLERLLLETDCPYLAPVPFRGRPNEPAFVPLVAQALAEVTGRSTDEVGIRTTANTGHAFPRWALPAEKEES